MDTLQLAFTVVLGMAVFASAEEDLPLCSSLTGTRFLSLYARASRPWVIEVDCKVPRGFTGFSTGFSLSKRFVCMEGTAVVVGPRFSRTYSCPTPLSGIPVDFVIPTERITIPTNAPIVTLPPLPPPPFIPEGELCSDLNGVDSRAVFISTSGVCQVSCMVRTGFAGFSAGFQSRTVYLCCNGQPAQEVGIVFRMCL